MDALPGTVDEWTLAGHNEAGQELWLRDGHPDDGVITLREGLSFDAYYARRAEAPEQLPVIDPVRAELDALKARIAALEATRVNIAK